MTEPLWVESKKDYGTYVKYIDLNNVGRFVLIPKSLQERISHMGELKLVKEVTKLIDSKRLQK